MSDLVATKLFAPRSRHPLVKRDRLDQLLTRPAALTLVSAPAGFGKSTAVGLWLESTRCGGSWFSLEADDNDPRRFLRYLLAAWRQGLPGLGRSLEAAMRTPGPLPDGELIRFLNEISTSTAEWVLVLDDFHLISEPSIHRFVEDLIDCLPPGLRLVLTTRVDPPFSLPSLRARGQLCEVRAAELRFSVAETRSLLGAAMGVELRAPEAEALRERTDGWVAGLQLAAVSLRGHQNPERFLVDFTGSHRFVIDYLTDEVLSGLDENTLEFLLRISFVDRVSGSLAEALVGFGPKNGSGQELLERLENQNLFLLSLDSERTWYRLHHLFAECLRRVAETRWTSDELRELHRRAADWLNEAGLPGGAIEHAVAGEDPARACAVLERHTDDAIRRGELHSISRWFDRVPFAWTEEEPDLVVSRALVLFLSLKWIGLEEVMPTVQTILSGEAGRVSGPGRLELLRLTLARARGQTESLVELGRSALAELPEADVFLRGIAATLLLEALCRAQDSQEAERAFQEAVSASRQCDNSLCFVSAHFHRGRWLMAQGQTLEALRCHRAALVSLSRAGRVPHVAAMARAGEAEVLLEQGYLDAAEEAALAAMELNSGTFPFPDLIGMVVRISVARTRRKLGLAQSLLDQFAEITGDAGLEPWLRHRAFYQAQVWVVEAELYEKVASRSSWKAWLREDGWLGPDGTLFDGRLEKRFLASWPWEGCAALYARWLIAAGELQEAVTIATELRELVEPNGWTRSVVTTWLLEAQSQLPDPGAALEAASQAVQLAAGADLIHVLADEREWLGPLLLDSDLLGDGSSLGMEYCRRLRVALEWTSAPAALPHQDLVEKLSVREVEVLASIAAGRKNAEAGRDLFISPSTVKKHLENIYGKLGVRGRVEAIAKARKLGLLQ